MAAWGSGHQRRLLLCAFGFLLLVDGAASSQDQRGEPGPGSCHADCTKFGNCGENGLCRCPFGRQGEACEIDFLAPCKPHIDGIPNCGTGITKSCECMRRCQQYFCRQGSNGKELCEMGLGYELKHGNERGCYEREGVPPEEQYSVIPEPDEPNVNCFSGHHPGSEPLSCSEALVRGGDRRNLAMSLCPDTNQCNNRGYCERPEGEQEGKPRCRCNRGYKGDKCETETHDVCYQGCSGRGKCIDQFCHCEPPYFSIGCTRSKVYPANYSRPSPVNFKIYMYDLPTSLAYEHAYVVGWRNHDLIYTAYQKFLAQFLVSPVRTEDPSEANLFFIPSFTFSYSGNVGSGEEHLHLVLHHIQQRHPHWNRSGGRDHFFWAPSDRGACFSHTNPLSSLLFDAIRVVHFGYHTTADSRGPLGELGHPDYGCLHPLRDVVAAPIWEYEEEAVEHSVGQSVDDWMREKTKLFFFAGDVRPDYNDYAGGTRLLLRQLVAEWGDPDLEFHEGYVGEQDEDILAKVYAKTLAGYQEYLHDLNIKYEARLRSAKFCLAAYGHGWGIRLQQALYTGCVPVIVQEHVFQPFEDLLPYEDFSLRLSNADLPQLREILRGISEEQYRRLLEGVQRHSKAFSWFPHMGGRAFEYTIAALRRRHMNLKSLYF